MVDTRLVRTILDVADDMDISREFMITMAYIESAFNPRAYNRGSRAAGLYQFLPSTARAYGLDDPFDPFKSARAAARLAMDNAKYIGQHGMSPEGAHLYLAHQQGMGGAVAIFKAAKRGQEVSSRIRRNMNSNGGRGKTPREFLANWISLYSKKCETALSIVRRDTNISIV